LKIQSKKLKKKNEFLKYKLVLLLKRKMI